MKNRKDKENLSIINTNILELIKKMNLKGDGKMKKMTTICMVLSMFFVFTAFSSALAETGSIAVPYFKYNPTIVNPTDIDIITEDSTISNTDSASVEVWIKAYSSDGTLIGELPASTDPGMAIAGNGSMSVDFSGLCNAMGVEAASFVVDWNGTVTSTPMVSLVIVGVDARNIPVGGDIAILK